jgi:PAS domain S-box-containing protein
MPWARQVRLGTMAGLAILCLIAMGLLAYEVRAKLSALQRASSDNTQWVMMQTEVEVLRLQAALQMAQSDPSPVRMDEIRRWFNVLYSRVGMLEQSPLYAPMLQGPDYAPDYAQLRLYLDTNVALIDAADPVLRDAIPEILAPLSEMRNAARSLTLNALSEFAAESDLSRESISSTLLRLAMVTGTLLLIIAGVAGILAIQFRRSEAQRFALRATSARLETIVSASADGIVVTDRRGMIREFNSAAEAIFGMPLDQVKGRQVFDTLFAEGPDGPQAHDLVAAIRDPSTRPGEPIRIVVDARRADGSVFPAEISIARAPVPEEGLVVAFVRDISLRRRDEAALTRALDQAQAGERTKAEFLAVMSHEMRTPLNGLIGSLDLMRRTSLSEEQGELLSVMQASGEILLAHVNSVLDVSRAEAGIILPEKARFSLDRLMEETVANQAGLAAAGGNRLTLSSLSGPLGWVTGDRSRLRQILLNLIGNAVKFTRNGEIGVEVERLNSPDDMVEFRITDTGIGIAEADLDRIFEDFVTLDSTYGRSAGGTGLGLGIARRLARGMGGDIGVESLKDEGSLFWLRLPLPVAEADLVAPPADQTAGAAGLNSPSADSETLTHSPPLDILLVEDNAINRFLMNRFLESAGHRVTEAHDGIEAIACAAQRPFDVILMDISMPRLDGVSATRTIRQGKGPNAGTRILALTAHALPQEQAQFRAVGMETALTKPVIREDLLRALHPASAAKPPSLQTLPAATFRTEEDTSQPPVLDPEALDQMLRQLGPATARTLIQRLIADGDGILAELTTLSPDVEAAEIAALCHRLAGSSGTFGTRALGQALMSVETAVKTSDPAKLRLAYDTLPAIWQETRAHLIQRLAEMSQPDAAPIASDGLHTTSA